MTRTRLALVTSALVAGVLLVESVITILWGIGFQAVANSNLTSLASGENGRELQQLFAGLPVELFFTLISRAAFGLGVFLSLRFLGRIEENLRWSQVVARGLLATAIAAVTVLATNVVEVILRSIAAGPYPFGYSFDPSIDTTAAQAGVFNAIGGTLPMFLTDAPLVILACLLLKIWLTARTPAGRTTGG